MEESLLKNYTEILENELVPAMGCTEPIAIAYAAASARKLLSEEYCQKREGGNRSEFRRAEGNAGSCDFRSSWR